MLSPLRKQFLCAITIIIAYASIKLIPCRLNSVPICPFYHLTGIPCPGCGLTRATIAILNGEFHNALLLNPLSFLVDCCLIIYLLWFSIDAIRNRDTINALLKKNMEKKILNACVVDCFFELGIYRITIFAYEKWVE